MKNAGLSDRELARHIGATHTQVAKWRTGRETPRLPVAAELARFLRVSLDWMTDPDGPAAPAGRPPLSAVDLAILDVARRVGPAEALRRLATEPADGGAESCQGGH